MKVGIIGAGAVGSACAKALLLRGSCHGIVLLDKVEDRAVGVATDLSHGEPLCPPTRVAAGHYDDLSDVAVVVITAGINELAGGATDRKDKRGRLRLLPDNANVYREVVPLVSEAVSRAPILVVTDPPDPLADLARQLCKGTNQIISVGTFLDTLRFRVQLAGRLECHPSSVDALVIGEHGTSQVYVWSSAQVGGHAVLDLARQKGYDEETFRTKVEKAVKYANIDIIEGNGASQHGIGIATARIVEAILRDEKLVAPVGVFQDEFKVTLSLPAVIGQYGVSKVLMPRLSAEETKALTRSAKAIATALASLSTASKTTVRRRPRRRRPERRLDT